MQRTKKSSSLFSLHKIKAVKKFSRAVSDSSVRTHRQIDGAKYNVDTPTNAKPSSSQLQRAFSMVTDINIRRPKLPKKIQVEGIINRLRKGLKSRKAKTIDLRHRLQKSDRRLDPSILASLGTPVYLRPVAKMNKAGDICVTEAGNESDKRATMAQAENEIKQKLFLTVKE